jgi:hypothetical protein
MLDLHQLATTSFARRARVIRVPFGLMNIISSAKTTIIKNTIKTNLKTCHAKILQKNLTTIKESENRKNYSGLSVSAA